MGCLKKILSFGTIAALQAFALETVNITGNVQDANGLAIEGATTSLVNAGLEAQTDANGDFSLVRKGDEIVSNDSAENTLSIYNLSMERSSNLMQNGYLMLSSSKNNVVLESAFCVNGRILSNVGNRSFGGTQILYAAKRNQPVSKKVLAKTVEGVFDTLAIEKEGFLSQRIALATANENLGTIKLDTVPVAILTKRGEGSKNQTVAQNSKIVDFNFAFDNCDSVAVEGMPEGVSVTVIVSKKTVNITGTVTAKPGTYNFKITTVGGYTTASTSGAITVTEPIVEENMQPTTLVADGYASLNGGTTGGAGGDTATVSTYADFKAAVQAKGKKVVVVKGTVKTTDGDGYGLQIESDKTIMGKDSSATIYGGLAIKGKNNVIIYNINIHGTYPNPGPSDGIVVTGGSTNVWVHHVNIWDAEDGNLDITGQANYVTVSYVKFWYTDKNHPHRLNGLIGSGAADHPEDFGKLKVTYHHNWFSTLVNERMPRVMYGNAHIYNNYYNAPGNLYCVGVGSYGSALIENNYFENVNNPINFMYNIYAFILQRNNVFKNTTGTQDGTSSGKIYGERYITTDPYTLLKDPDKLMSVPYKYDIDAADKVPNIVQQQAGPHNLK